MSAGELLGNRIKTPAREKTPLEFWTFGVLRALIRSDQPGLELLPAGATPETPKKGRVVLFARESGADTGKYQLCVMGWGGSVQILFTEP
jgi:hypothetical protein